MMISGRVVNGEPVNRKTPNREGVPACAKALAGRHALHNRVTPTINLRTKEFQQMLISKKEGGVT